ncbi:helix-turn-helix domain-containing protein [Enterococcus sp. AZ103]|uniref:helix-turn-helix domain-containing protein n=1 Tax=Enterococcus sp. AZ103 TaxID=2774628 RepID=UPI003F294C48
MLLRDLLNNYEKRQLQALDLLLRRPYTTSQLCQALHVSRDTVKEDLIQLKAYEKTVNAKISIEKINGYYHIKSFGKLSNTEINHYFLQHSLSYEILIYILLHGEYQLDIMSTDLNTSVATVIRKIRQLNQILKEFELTIAGGKVHGTELQIRYFYYLLIWYSKDYQQKKELYLGYSGNLIQQLRVDLNFVLSEQEAIKQSIWFYVTKKRFENRQISDQSVSLEKKYPPKIITGLENILESHYKNIGIFWDEQETISYQLFLFVTTEIYENKDKFLELYQKNIDYLTALKVTNDEVSEKLWKNLMIQRTSWLKELLDMTIFKINLWGYYFPGFIDIFQYEMKSTSQPVKKRVDAAMKVVEKRLQIDSQGNGQMMAKYFGALLENNIKATGFSLTVAYNTGWDDFITEEKIRNILSSIEWTVNLKIMRYEEGKSYDVILSDSNRDFEGIPSERIYILLSLVFGLNVDRQELSRFIKTHYENKLEGV